MILSKGESLLEILERVRLSIKCNKKNGNPPDSLSWEIAVQAEDFNDFKKTFNLLRRIYSDMLIRFILEKCSNFCYPKKIGTINPTISSDIDIEIVFNISLLKDKLEKIDFLYKTINEFHNMYFPGHKYNELFDINIYASGFIKSCQKKPCLMFDDNKAQRLWSMSRLIEYYSEIHSFIPNNNHKFTSLIKNTLDMIKAIPINTNQKEEQYIEELHRYFDILIRNENDIKSINKAANAFSLTKYYEDDTYRSIGAYLHIVAGDKNLSKNLYMDSFMDNFGFVIENILSSNTCMNIPIEWKILRVAKYMERMIDCLLLIDKNFKSEFNLTVIKKTSKILNDMRKKVVSYDNPELIQNINIFMRELRIPFNTEYYILQYLFKFVAYHYDVDLKIDF